MIDADAWRGRRVLVTGHTGFKGAWLAVWLSALGARVTGYALDPPTRPSLFESARVGELVDDRRADIRDADALRRVVEQADPEVVFHLAAQPLVLEGYRQPVETFSVNVVGTANVLEACRHAQSLRAVVNVTTDKCYDNREWVWGYRENDALGGADPYSASKACSELVTESFRRAYFARPTSMVGVATARAGNVIGGGDWAADRLVADAARAVLQSRPLVVRRPDAVRPWQHVLEPLGGYLLLAQRLVADPVAASGAWNFGPAEDACRPVVEVVERLARLWRGALTWSVDVDPDLPHEAGRLALDSTKAQRLLGWMPRFDLDTALACAVEWYAAASRGGQDLRALMLRQIEAHERAGARIPRDTGAATSERT